MKQYLNVCSTLIYLGTLKAVLYQNKGRQQYQPTGVHQDEWTSSEEILLKCTPLIFGALQLKEKEETINKVVYFQQCFRYLLFLSIRSIGTLLFKLYSKSPIMSV